MGLLSQRIHTYIIFVSSANFLSRRFVHFALPPEWMKESVAPASPAGYAVHVWVFASLILMIVTLGSP
jgi:hypothetical protein